MSSSPLIFQPSAVIQGLARAQKNYADHNFLLHWCARSLCDRLEDIKRDFHKVLILSVREAEELTPLFPNADITILERPIVTPQDIPVGEGYDLILSSWDVHKINDVPGVLACLRHALKPDGVFLACLPGGETLHELRTCLLHAELKILGGASPRVFPFVDKQQVGALLQRAGFSLPVVDSDIVHVSYRDIFHLMADIRGMGERNSLAGRYRSFTPSRLFFEAGKHYAEVFGEDDGRISASFEMIFLIGWAPHDGQQQPAKRGSGKVPLSDVL